MLISVDHPVSRQHTCLKRIEGFPTGRGKMFLFCHNRDHTLRHIASLWRKHSWQRHLIQSFHKFRIYRKRRVLYGNMIVVILRII